MAGALANNSGTFATSALAIGPFKCVWRPSSSANASNTPNVVGPNRNANQSGVVGSCFAIASPASKNFATSFSLPGLASNHANRATLYISIFLVVELRW